MAGTSTLNPESNLRSHIFRTAPNQPINPATDDLGTLAENEPGVMGMNDRGDIVGILDLFPDYDRQSGFVVLGSRMFDLNDLIDPASGWTLDEAYDINNLGQVVGVGSYNGDNHTFRLDPVPEPSSILLITGAGLLGCFRPRSFRLGMIVADARDDRVAWKSLNMSRRKSFSLHMGAGAVE